MASFLVENALETIKKLTAGFSMEEKADLLAQLPVVLEVAQPTLEKLPSQQQLNTVSGVSQSGNSGNVFNFAPAQAGGDITANQTITQTSNPDIQEALDTLISFQEKIDQDKSLNSLQKANAKAEVEKLQSELQKDKPSKSFVKDTVETLKQGLNGVISLAKPTQEVAALMAKLLAFTII